MKKAWVKKIDHSKKETISNYDIKTNYRIFPIRSITLKFVY